MRKRVVILLVCMCVVMALGSCGSNLSEVPFEEEEDALAMDEADSVTKRHEGAFFGIDERRMVDVVIRTVYYTPSSDEPVTTYEYDDEGNRIKQTIYNQKGDMYKWFEYEYDDGKKVKEMIYDKDMDSSYRRKYEYDDRGRPTGWIQYDDLNERIVQLRRYEYDTDGNKVREVVYDSEGETLSLYENEYNEAGKVVKTIIRNKDSAVYWEENVYEYDEKKDVVNRVLVYDPDSEKMIRKNEYEYDKSGNLIKVTTYDDENIVSWVEFEYVKVNKKTGYP